jgi:hypothetical protein
MKYSKAGGSQYRAALRAAAAGSSAGYPRYE